MKRHPPGLIARLAIIAAFVVLSVAAMNIVTSPTHAASTSSTVDGLIVYVGYAENKETNTPPPAAFPVPWQGAPNTTFLGGPVVGQTQCHALPTCFDAGAIRLDNPGTTDVTVSDTFVDVHSSITGGKTFDLWGSYTVPAGKSVILTENPPNNNPSFDNFDTSGFPQNNCTPITVAPTIKFTIGGVATTLVDSTHVLDTGGIDTGFCSPKQNESIQWRQIGTPGVSTATLTLSPSTTTLPVGQHVTETATLQDGGGNPVPNANVAFNVTGGPNAGQTGSATTDATGTATFTYADTAAGIDTVVASVTTMGTFQSNQTTVNWGNVTPTPTPTPIPGVPVQLSNLTVADTANAANWSLQTNFQAGAVQYGDRGYTLTTIPSNLAGMSWIRTAMASKAFTGNPTVTFTIDQQAVVYVVLDSRATPVPSWLDSSWTLTSLTITNNEAAGHNTFVLYSKTFPAGTVSLGDNDNGNTGVNMYTVVVFGTGGATTPTPTPTTVPASPTPTATTAPSTPTPTPTTGPVQLSNLNVADTANAANWSFQTNIQVGAVQYGDRGYTLTAVPASLAGSAWIRTGMGSKAYTGNPTVTFTINQQATVYVVLDSRVTTPPSWLDSSWTLTGLTLTNNEVAGRNTFVIYSNTFPAGAVSLGENDNGNTGVSMYTVIVQ
jgi:hypothetical protein